MLWKNGFTEKYLFTNLANYIDLKIILLVYQKYYLIQLSVDDNPAKVLTF